jgi:hypothetical protein
MKDEVEAGPPRRGWDFRCVLLRRVHQFILIGSCVLGSWLLMQAVHESGHVLGASLTGGRVGRVVLYPLTISRTDLIDNPSPLIVVWAGPIMGVVVPMLICLIATSARLRNAFVARFFAGFCLVANGLYIGVGSFGHVGDCGDMLRHGSPTWQLWLFGIVTVPVGLWLWHGQGSNFGLGQARGHVSRTAAYGSLAASVALLLAGFIFGGE